MSGKRFGSWALPLLMLGVLTALLLLLILYPARAQRRPELLEMSVIAREADSSAWSTARQGMEQAAADLNVELRFLFPAQPDSAREQAQLLRREVESGASAILLFPADREALAEEVRETSARAALVTLETDMAEAAGYVGVDNAALGEALAKAALNGVSREGTVLLVDSPARGSGVGDRQAAAEAVLESQVREIRHFTGTADELAEELSRGRAQAVVAFEASSLERAAEAVSRTEDAPLLYGVGSTAAVTAGLEQGHITSILAQNAFSAGYLAVQSAARTARRETVEPLDPLPFFTVRRENMYEPENQKLLFPVTW